MKHIGQQPTSLVHEQDPPKELFNRNQDTTGYFIILEHTIKTPFKKIYFDDIIIIVINSIQ